jgi:hypothetical protein
MHGEPDQPTVERTHLKIGHLSDNLASLLQLCQQANKNGHERFAREKAKLEVGAGVATSSNIILLNHTGRLGDVQPAEPNAKPMPNRCQKVE